VPFCEMMASRDEYVDREVLVSGLYIMTPHRGEIYGLGCEAGSIALRGDVNLPEDDKRVPAIIRGAYRQISGARVPIVARGVLRKYRGSALQFLRMSIGWSALKSSPLMERTFILRRASVRFPPKTDIQCYPAAIRLIASASL
jgi:hypothetical protein